MNELPFDPEEASAKWKAYHRVMNLHYELASHYRAKSRDRKTIQRLWAAIDELEFQLRYMGVEL